MLQQTESGQLSPNRSRSTGLLEAAWDGLQAGADDLRGRLSSTHSCNQLPLTGIEDSGKCSPTALRQNAQWNGVDHEAEAELLRLLVK